MDEKNMELLTLCKQAVMKMESAMTDICEIQESELLTDDEKYTFKQMIEMNGNMMAVIVNMVAEKTGVSEEDFMSEQLEQDPIDEYPEAEQGEPVDILNDTID